MTPSSVITYSGTFIDLAHPAPASINAADIWNGLSKECRFGNQLDCHYSVAQHSVILSHIVPRKLKRYALLHDASEAYIHDIPTPFKKLLKEYLYYESILQAAIEEKFLGKQDSQMAESLEPYDRALMLKEAEVFGLPAFDTAPCMSINGTITPLEHRAACDLLRDRWLALGI